MAATVRTLRSAPTVLGSSFKPKNTSFPHTASSLLQHALKALEQELGPHHSQGNNSNHAKTPPLTCSKSIANCGIVP